MTIQKTNVITLFRILNFNVNRLKTLSVIEQKAFIKHMTQKINKVIGMTQWSAHSLSKRSVVGSNPFKGGAFITSQTFGSPNFNGYLASSPCNACHVTLLVRPK